MVTSQALPLRVAPFNILNSITEKISVNLANQMSVRSNESSVCSQVKLFNQQNKVCPLLFYTVESLMLNNIRKHNPILMNLQNGLIILHGH
jgi:hypothetical protein